MANNLTYPLTVAELARRYRVSPDKIRGWIVTGELHALNVATRAHGRPRYIIPAESLTEFEVRRTAERNPSTVRRRSRVEHDIIKFF